MGVDIPKVFVSLEKSKDYLVLQSGRFQTVITDPMRVIEMPANQTTQKVEFTIKLTAIGQIRLAVKASSKVAGDGEVKFLKVKSQGIQQSMISSALIKLDSSFRQFKNVLKNTITKQIYPDSEYCEVQVIGILNIF